MAINIKFTKFDNTPWGFRLAGGSDFPQPLTVIRVSEGSLAECMGLKVGDIVVRLNDQPISSLTHGQAHEALILAGNNFVLGIKREEDPLKAVEAITEENIVPYKIPLDQLPPVFPEKILQETTAIERNETTETIAPTQSVDEEKQVEEPLPDKPIDDNSEVVPNRNLTDDEIAQLILEEEELLNDKGVLGVNFNKLKPRAPLLKQSKVIAELQHIATAPPDQEEELRRTSVFLQKPQRPVPKPKKSEEPKPEIETPSETYKVVIKKQPKKSITVRLLEQGLLKPSDNKNPEYRSEVKMYVAAAGKNSASIYQVNGGPEHSVNNSVLDDAITSEDPVNNTVVENIISENLLEGVDEDAVENPLTSMSNNERLAGLAGLADPGSIRVNVTPEVVSPNDPINKDASFQLKDRSPNPNYCYVLSVDALDNTEANILDQTLMEEVDDNSADDESLLNNRNVDVQSNEYAYLSVNSETIPKFENLIRSDMLIEEEFLAHRNRSLNASRKSQAKHPNVSDARFLVGRVKFSRFIRGRYSKSCIRWYVTSCLCVLSLLANTIARKETRRRRSSIIQKGHYVESYITRKSSWLGSLKSAHFHEVLLALTMLFGNGKRSTKRARCARARYAERAIVKSVDSVAKYIVPSEVGSNRKMSQIFSNEIPNIENRRRSSVLLKTKGHYMNTCLEQQKVRFLSIVQDLPKMIKLTLTNLLWSHSFNAKKLCFRTRYVEDIIKQIFEAFKVFFKTCYRKSSRCKAFPSAILQGNNSYLKVRGDYFKSCCKGFDNYLNYALNYLDNLIFAKLPFVSLIKNSITSEVFHRRSRRLSLVDRRQSIKTFDAKSSSSWLDRLKNIISASNQLSLTVNEEDSCLEKTCEGKIAYEADRDGRRLSFIPTILYEGITNRIGIDFTRLVALAFVPCVSIVLIYIYK